MSKNSALRSLCVIGIILTFSILPVCAQTVLPSANAPLFVASAATRTAGVDGTTDFIGVAGTPNYSVSSNTDWATIKKTTGGVNVNVARNNTGSQRIATLTFTNDDLAASTSSSSVQISSLTANQEETTGEGTVSGFASAAIDGNTSTYYHSPWQSGSTSMPITWEFTLTDLSQVNQFVYIPRAIEYQRNPKDITFYYSAAASGDDWQVIGSTQLAEQFTSSQTYDFPSTVSAKRIKAVVTSMWGNWVCAAELKFNKVTSNASHVYIVQESNVAADYGDYQVNIASGLAASTESGDPITQAFDGNGSTVWHSKWTSATTFPTYVLFTFEEATDIYKMLYQGRYVNNTNGHLKEVEVWYSTSARTNLNTSGYTKIGTTVFADNVNEQTYDFGQTYRGVRTVLLKINSSYSRSFCSIAEVKFLKPNEGKVLSDYTTLFKDNLCTQLKSGIGATEIAAATDVVAKRLATDILNNNYDTEYRVGNYICHRSLSNLQSELHNSHQYDRYENSTGIYMDEGETVVILAENISSRYPVMVKVLQLDSSHPGGSATSNIQLKNGVNTFTSSVAGNVYIDYYSDNYKNAPAVGLHIIYGQQNGYFKYDPAYPNDPAKSDSNEKWKKLLANAKSEVIDIVTPRMHMLAPLYALKAQCPARGSELAEKLDSIVYREWEILGYYKQGVDVSTNHQVCRPAASGIFAGGEGAYLNWGGFGAWVVPVFLPTWGIAHELGHNNQISPFTWTGMTEVSNNVCSAWVQYALPKNTDQPFRLEDEYINCSVGSVRGGRIQNFVDMDVTKTVKTLYSEAYHTAAGENYHWQNETEYNNANTDHFVALVPLWQMILYTMGDAAGYAPDAFPGMYTDMRQNYSTYNALSAAEKRLNFFRVICEQAQLNFIPFFEKANMFEPLDNVFIDDYSSGYMTITQSQLNQVRATIEAYNYEKVPSSLVFMNNYNYKRFRDKVVINPNQFPVNTGCTATTLNGHSVIKVDNYVWEGAVGYEACDAEGNVLHATTFGLGDAVASDRYTYAIWKLSGDTETPAYLRAVGYDDSTEIIYQP